MRSDRLLALLRSQGLGLVLGLSVVVLLAAGSVTMALTQEGASRHVRMDDLWVFFREASWAHLWLYLLFPVFGLYAVNTLLATVHTVTRRVRAGIRAPGAYAASVIHLGFLVALFAHLVGGFGSEERGVIALGPRWAPLGDGREARLVSLAVDRLPDGGVKEVRAEVEGRGPDGPFAATVGYNRPLSFDAGTDLVLLLQPREAQGMVLLRHRHAPGNPWALASALLILVGLGMMVRRFFPAARAARAPDAAAAGEPEALDRAA